MIKSSTPMKSEQALQYREVKGGMKHKNEGERGQLLESISP